MNLNSERLAFVHLNKSELDNYLSWYTNNEVMSHITGAALTQKQALERFNKALEINANDLGLGFYSVKLKNLTFIGIAKIVMMDHSKAEIGYGSLPEYWGFGYATEMLRWLIEFGKSINEIKELIGIVNIENLNSKKVLTKQSFKFISVGIENGKTVEYYLLNL